MRIRNAAVLMGGTTAGLVAGLIGLSATVDSPRLDKVLDRLRLDVNPVPLGLLFGGAGTGFALARRHNRRRGR